MDLYEHRILIVDDEPALQKMVSDFLYKEGYRQVAAAGAAGRQEVRLKGNTPI